MKHIAEVGLNHLGSKNLLRKYLKYLDKLKIYGITLQITDKKFFKGKYKKLFIDYDDSIKILKKNVKKKKIGLVTDSLEVLHNFKNKVNFFKILSKDFYNDKLITSALKTKKKTYISTGMVNYNEIKKFSIKYKSYKNLILIHTQLTNDINLASLSSIQIIKKLSPFKVAFGFHSVEKKILFCSVPYLPDSIFIYVKDNDNKKYPDDFHACKLYEYKKLIADLDTLKKSITDKKKKFANWR
tara:strand:+ start:9302 stop:10024 length:723 start_codon:yes stop_codon:yes gene_type:complete